MNEVIKRRNVILLNEHKLWLDYGDWLVRRVGFQRKGYGRLMDLMHLTPFRYTVERDKNRAEDGKYLRAEFCKEYGLYPEYLELGRDIDHGASVLEVLVALACRLDSEYIGDPGIGHPDEIFWEFLCNLGLDIPRARDAHFRTQYCYDILMFWMDRRYNRRGEGGIFPMRKSRYNQRNRELWDQAMEWVSERYG